MIPARLKNIATWETAQAALFGVGGLLIPSLYKIFVEPSLEGFKDPISEFFTARSLTNGLVFVAILTCLAAVGAMIADRAATRSSAMTREARLREELRSAQEEIGDFKRAREKLKADSELQEQEFRRERNVDYVTGIFNNRAFNLDLQKRIDFHLGKVAQEVSEGVSQSSSNSKIGKRCDCVIMIDFNGFGQINKIFSFEAGNVVIRTIAQVINGSIRRNEFMYRKKPDAPTHADVYRRHTGGDEFLILFQGDEGEALHFLRRLKNDVVPACEVLVRSALREIFQGKKDAETESLRLTFAAGIAQILNDDKIEEIMDRVDGCFWSAKDGSFGTSVVWRSLFETWESIQRPLLQDSITVASFAEFDANIERFKVTHPLLVQQLRDYTEKFPLFDRHWTEFSRK